MASTLSLTAKHKDFFLSFYFFRNLQLGKYEKKNCGHDTIQNLFSTGGMR